MRTIGTSPIFLRFIPEIEFLRRALPNWRKRRKLPWFSAEAPEGDGVWWGRPRSGGDLGMVRVFSSYCPISLAGLFPKRLINLQFPIGEEVLTPIYYVRTRRFKSTV